MHEKEDYLDALYDLQEKVKAEAIAFAKSGNFDKTGIQFFDTLMHGAKNLRKEIMGEEGYFDSGEEYEGTSGTTQARGRSIRTTPGMTSGESSSRSMRSAQTSSMRGSSGRRDARGRFATSGTAEDAIEMLRRKANMTTDHDERDILLSTVEWMQNET